MTAGKGNSGWPVKKDYSDRYFVPDLSVEQREQLQAKSFKPRLIFVAESPHEAEVSPLIRLDRRPLCGRAGQVWWKMISQILTGQADPQTDLTSLLKWCRQGRFLIMNAVQYPLDPKIVLHCGPHSDPVTQLGFSKVAPASYKKLRAGKEVGLALDALRARLFHPSVLRLPVVSLGNDAAWFVTRALGSEFQERHWGIVPHPSAWWRAGGKFQVKAEAQLRELLGENGAMFSSQSQVFHQSLPG